MGRPLPGYRLAILDGDGVPAPEGEISLPVGHSRPAGLMYGYDVDGMLVPVPGEHYRTGDIVTVDEDGYLRFVGRSDVVFKSADYRISPFELESVLIEHPAVAEAAVIPSPDPVRMAVPKAFVSLAANVAQSRDIALSLFQHVRKQVGPYKRIRRIEIVHDLPKTISGKIRRVQLRAVELGRDDSEWKRGVEYTEDDFPDLARDSR
jgi:acetyl-CoA synthetase